jgi:hypothetical protein
MTSVREVDMKEIISLTKKKYSVLKEGIKNDECGWSYLCTFGESASVQGGWLHAPGGHRRLQGIQARALAWCWPPGGRGWRRVARLRQRSQGRRHIYSGWCTGTRQNSAT